MQLLLFNLKIDCHDKNLAFNLGWAKKLSTKFSVIHLITTEYKAGKLPSNVNIYSLKKKNNSKKKIILILRFYFYLFKILLNNNSRIKLCFGHMSPLYIVLSYFFLKILNIPRLLWYTHSQINFLHRMSFLCSTKVITAGFVNKNFKFNKKFIHTGHGIDLQNFKNKKKYHTRSYFRLVCIGRLSKIKQIKKIIEAFNLLKNIKTKKKFKLDIIGSPTNNIENLYKKELYQLAKKNKILNLRFLPAVDYRNVNSKILTYDLLISLSRTNSVDKMILEAMSTGIMVLTNNIAFQKVLPKNLKKYNFLNSASKKKICKKIIQLSDLSLKFKETLSKESINYIEKNHNLDNLIEKILLFVKKN